MITEQDIRKLKDNTDTSNSGWLPLKEFLDKLGIITVPVKKEIKHDN